MPDTTARAGLLAAASIGCLLWLTVALATMHVLRPDYDASHFISDYAVGDYAWVMTSHSWP